MHDRGAVWLMRKFDGGRRGRMLAQVAAAVLAAVALLYAVASWRVWAWRAPRSSSSQRSFRWHIYSTRTRARGAETAMRTSASFTIR